jgi:PadR family transcriptional regulator PadR
MQQPLPFGNLPSYTFTMPRRKPGSLLPLELRIIESALELQRTEDSAYGFRIARELSSGNATALISHGTLYKALNRMDAMGMLESEWEAAEIAEAEGRPRRRLYRVTAEGARALASQTKSTPSTTPAAARIKLA